MRRTLKFKLRSLMIVIAISALTSLWFKDVFVSPYKSTAPAGLMAPLQTTVQRHPNGDLSSTRVTYCEGAYGVSEFGNIRLAVEGCTFSGRSSGRLYLASGAIGSRSGATGAGNRRFTYSSIDGGSACTFAGLSFEIVKGELRILGESFPVDSEPRVIVIDTDGKIEAVAELSKADIINPSIP